MKTPLRIRRREAARKAVKRRENVQRLQLMKQTEYFNRTGNWVDNPRMLHWHHKDPARKTRRISHLISRSWERISHELSNCEVLYRDEHIALHANAGQTEQRKGASNDR